MSTRTDVEVRNIISSLKTEYGARPPLDVIANRLEVPIEQARTIWARFSKDVSVEEIPGDPTKSDKPPVASSGVPPRGISKKRTHPAKRKKPVVEQAANNLEKAADHLHEPPVGVIRLMAFLVSVVLIFRPIGYAHDYFARGNEDWLAWTMALGLGGAAFVAPQIAILGFRNRSVWTVLAGALLIMASFWSSIQVTLSELTYLRTKSQTEFVQAAAKVTTVETQRADWERTFNTQKEARDAAQKKVDALVEQGRFTLVGSQEYWQNKADIKVAEKPRDAAQAKMDEADDELKKLPADVHEATVGAADQRTMEIGYQTDAAFAITQDVVGPLMLAMAVFLRKKSGVKVWWTRRKKVPKTS